MEDITKATAESLNIADKNGAAAPAPAMPDGPDLIDMIPMAEAYRHKNMTLEETIADLKKSPLFMTDLDEAEMANNEDLAALQALAYEGTPLENATNFKEQGNESFREKRWADAKEFYGKGVSVLVTAERERKQAKENGGVVPPKPKAAPAPPKSSGGGDAKKEGEGVEDDIGEPEHHIGKVDVTATSPEEIQQERALLETLYVNRAACHLSLKNFRSCWLDCGQALRLNPSNIKAYYRSARALLSVDRITEADDACARGLEVDSSNASLQALAKDIVKRNREIAAKKAREEARLSAERQKALLLKAALKARMIRTRTTEKPPEMEDAKVTLVPDPLDPKSAVAFPTMLLYPLHLETDFIKAFSETESLEQHFGYVFPLPWDREGAYSTQSVECYMETASGGLVKVGKKVPLLKVLSGGTVEVVDDLVKIFVVPRNKAEAWVRDFKAKKAAEKEEAAKK